jgi:hypothetical protein
MSEHPKRKWSSLLSEVVDKYNKTVHSVTGFKPIYLMLGTDDQNANNPSVPEARLIAVQKLNQFKQKKKDFYDSNHKTIVLNSGNLVKRLFLLIIYRRQSSHQNSKARSK